MENMAQTASKICPKKLNIKTALSGAIKSKNAQSLIIDIVHQESATLKNTTELWFKTNKDIKIFRVTVKTGLFKDEVAGDENMVFEKKQWYQLAGYENVRDGQKWRFIFLGLHLEKDSRFMKEYKYTI